MRISSHTHHTAGDVTGRPGAPSLRRGEPRATMLRAYEPGIDRGGTVGSPNGHAVETWAHSFPVGRYGRSRRSPRAINGNQLTGWRLRAGPQSPRLEIGRASCRERV